MHRLRARQPSRAYGVSYSEDNEVVKPQSALAQTCSGSGSSEKILVLHSAPEESLVSYRFSCQSDKGVAGRFPSPTSPQRVQHPVFAV